MIIEKSYAGVSGNNTFRIVFKFNENEFDRFIHRTETPSEKNITFFIKKYATDVIKIIVKSLTDGAESIYLLSPGIWETEIYTRVMPKDSGLALDIFKTIYERFNQEWVAAKQEAPKETTCEKTEEYPKTNKESLDKKTIGFVQNLLEEDDHAGYEHSYLHVTFNRREKANSLFMCSHVLSNFFDCCNLNYRMNVEGQSSNTSYTFNINHESDTEILDKLEKIIRGIPLVSVSAEYANDAINKFLGKIKGFIDETVSNKKSDNFEKAKQAYTEYKNREDLNRLRDIFEEVLYNAKRHAQLYAKLTHIPEDSIAKHAIERDLIELSEKRSSLKSEFYKIISRLEKQNR